MIHGFCDGKQRKDEVMGHSALLALMLFMVEVLVSYGVRETALSAWA